MVRKAILGAVLLLALVASPAAAQYEPFVVTPGTVIQGGTVTVSGSACDPDEVVEITLGRADGTGTRTVVATSTADKDGNYSASFVVPADLAPGEYMVYSSCGSGVNGARLTVTGKTTPSTPPGRGTNQGTGGTGGNRSNSTLARTGSDLDRVGLAGAGLLVVGGLLLVATKRRRHAPGMAA